MAELFAKRAATVVAIGTALFHLYTAFFGTLLTQKIIHLALICTLAFPTAPWRATLLARWVGDSGVHMRLSWRRLSVAATAAAGPMP